MHGLYVLWWVQEKHVSVAAVAAILAAGDLAITVLEVPTGWFADRFGHRRSLIVGSVLQVCGMLLAWLGTGIPGILTSSLVIGIGDTFRSGADQALLYRSCVACGEPSFQAIEGRSHGLELGALVALVLAGGAIVDTWGFAAGWVAETLLCAIGLVIACAMVEPPAADEIDESGERSQAPLKWCPTPDILAAGSLPTVILPAAMLIAVASSLTFFIQSSDALDPIRMTAFVATVTLAEAAGAFAGAYVTGGVRTQMILTGTALIVGIAAIVVPSIVQPAVVVLCFLMGVIVPVRAATIQRMAADAARARAASLASACDKGLASVALVLTGLFARRVK